MNTCTAFRALWLKRVPSAEVGRSSGQCDSSKFKSTVRLRPSARDIWQREAFAGAARLLAKRFSPRLLETSATAEHLLMGSVFMHLEGSLHLSERALQYLMRQQPDTLKHDLGPTTAQRCRGALRTLFDEHLMANCPSLVIRLSLLHHRETLLPHETEQLEHFVLRMPGVLREFDSPRGKAARVASCCYLKGVPLYWQVAPADDYHRDL